MSTDMRDMRDRDMIHRNIDSHVLDKVIYYYLSSLLRILKITIANLIRGFTPKRNLGPYLATAGRKPPDNKNKHLLRYSIQNQTINSSNSC